MVLCDLEPIQAFPDASPPFSIVKRSTSYANLALLKTFSDGVETSHEAEGT